MDLKFYVSRVFFDLLMVCSQISKKLVYQLCWYDFLKLLTSMRVLRRASTEIKQLIFETDLQKYAKLCTSVQF